MSKIIIEGLQLEALIGVFEFERHAKQRIVVDVEMVTDLSKASQTDNIEDTVSYKDICDGLEHLAGQCQYALLEALGKDMLDMIMSFAPIQSATLSLSKPDIIANATNVAIQMTRSREQ